MNLIFTCNIYITIFLFYGGLFFSQTVLVTAAAGALGLATVDIAANALGAKVCRFTMISVNILPKLSPFL